MLRQKSSALLLGTRSVSSSIIKSSNDDDEDDDDFEDLAADRGLFSVNNHENKKIITPYGSFK